MNWEADDPSLGPLFPKPDKYTTKQLQQFSKKLTDLRFWFTEEGQALKTEGPHVYNTYRNLLFDNSIVRAQLLLIHHPYSKRLLLRLVQRFFDCLNTHNAYIDISEWFIIRPLPPRTRPAQAQTNTESPDSDPDFDPTKPSTSTGKQRK